MSIFRHLKAKSPITHHQEIVAGEYPQYQCWTTVSGPRGTIRCWDIGYVDPDYYTANPDRLAELYDTVCAVADGHYHCCLTGKIFLL